LIDDPSENSDANENRKLGIQDQFNELFKPVADPVGADDFYYNVKNMADNVDNEFYDYANEALQLNLPQLAKPAAVMIVPPKKPKAAQDNLESYNVQEHTPLVVDKLLAELQTTNERIQLDITVPSERKMVYQGIVDKFYSVQDKVKQDQRPCFIRAIKTVKNAFENQNVFGELDSCVRDIPKKCNWGNIIRGCLIAAFGLLLGVVCVAAALHTGGASLAGLSICSELIAVGFAATVIAAPSTIGYGTVSAINGAKKETHSAVGKALLFAQTNLDSLGKKNDQNVENHVEPMRRNSKPAI
jgi:hypothetical protein